MSQNEGERGVALGWLESAEEAFWISEDVLGTYEPGQGSLGAQDGDFRGDRRAGAFRIAELFARAYGAPGDVMGYDHADRAFDLLWGASHETGVDGGGGDGSVDDVVDLVSFQAENFRETTPDLVQKDHAQERGGAVESSG